VSRPKGRTAACSREDARQRLRHAESFLYAADLTLGERVETAEDDSINLSGVAAALAVLAGIAAADAACCHRLGMRSRGRSRGQDHAQAVALVRDVIPHGQDIAKDLHRLLDLKDNAHYGILGVSDAEARRAVDWARRTTDRAREVLEG
jgi:hypothetical protein